MTEDHIFNCETCGFDYKASSCFSRYYCSDCYEIECNKWVPNLPPHRYCNVCNSEYLRGNLSEHPLPEVPEKEDLK